MVCWLVRIYRWYWDSCMRPRHLLHMVSGVSSANSRRSGLIRTLTPLILVTSIIFPFSRPSLTRRRIFNESGVLEMSNVDLSSEFTTMITTQRGFQANSRIITTTSQFYHISMKTAKQIVNSFKKYITVQPSASLSRVVTM